MALINCPECNTEVSDQAKNCPKCGYGIASITIVKDHINRKNSDCFQNIQPLINEADSYLKWGPLKFLGLFVVTLPLSILCMIAFIKDGNWGFKFFALIVWTIFAYMMYQVFVVDGRKKKKLEQALDCLKNVYPNIPKDNLQGFELIEANRYFKETSYTDAIYYSIYSYAYKLGADAVSTDINSGVATYGSINTSGGKVKGKISSDVIHSGHASFLKLKVS